MHPDTRMFIDGLFKRCQALEQPFLTLSAIHPGGDYSRPSRHIPLWNENAVAYAVRMLERANAAGWGAYFGVALRKSGLDRWHRGTKSDLLALPALFIDIDDLADNVLGKVANFALPPSCLISSGKGAHLYWYLTEPSSAFAACEQAMRGLAALFKGDVRSSSAHSMRLVGTINTKPGRNTLCQLIHHEPDRHYALGEFFKHLPSPETTQTVRHRRAICLPDTGEIPGRERIEHAKCALLDRVERLLDGTKKSNGFLASLCPHSHHRDRRGLHFNFSPSSGVGICFGRHGRIEFVEMCQLLGVSI